MKTLSCEEFDAYESSIDTEYFGIPSAKAILKKACSKEQKQDELLGFLQSFEFLIITNKANDPINNLWLGEKTHAFLTDINIQFQKKLSAVETEENITIEISDNLPENNQIVQIAETSFRFSQFLNDPYLPKEKARCIYGDIVKNAFKKPGRFFISTKIGTAVAGFLLFSINVLASSSTIELIAVNQDFIKLGIGQALLNSMESYVYSQGIRVIFVGTQLNNVGAISFYHSAGFRFLDCSSIYHYWPLKHQ